MHIDLAHTWTFCILGHLSSPKLLQKSVRLATLQTNQWVSSYCHCLRRIGKVQRTTCFFDPPTFFFDPPLVFLTPQLAILTPQLCFLTPHCFFHPPIFLRLSWLFIACGGFLVRKLCKRKSFSFLTKNLRKNLGIPSISFRKPNTNLRNPYKSLDIPKFP